jgi:adenylate cyclase
MTPSEVISLLNVYFPPMADIVFRHEGTLEKYIGDALLALWGAPFVHRDDPVRAVSAAAGMQVALRRLVDDGLLPSHLQIHVGINTGVVAAGNIGSGDYVQYATIGDATNVASRICGVARAGEIVIDECTAELVGGSWPLQPIGPVRLKGKSDPMSLFRVAWG